MEKNVLIKFTAESELGGVNAELQSLRDRERDIANEMRKLQQDYQKQVFSIQATNKSREQQVQAIEKVRQATEKQTKALESEMSKTQSTISEFSAKMSAVNNTIAKGAVSTPKFTTQLRAMKDELAKMEEAGISPTDKGFIKLAVSAAKMEDQIGDTRQRISHLASDTKNLDAAMSLGQGLAGGFTVATSAAALLGGESEELQKAFFKVQAVLQLLNGVQMVANTLNKDSVASVVLGTAVEESNTGAKVKNTVSKYANIAATKLETAAENGSKVAKAGSTVAQWALNSAMLANPVFWLIGGIMALVGAYMVFKNAADDTKEVQERLNFTLKETAKDIESIDSNADFDVRIAEAAGKSVAEIRKIRLEAVRAKIALAEMASDEVSRAGSKATKEQREEAQKMLRDAYKAEKKYFDDVVVEDIKSRKDADKKRQEQAKQAADKAKQAADKAKQEREKRNQEIIQAQKELEDTLNALMRDGMIKEIDAIENSYKRKIDAIKGNSKDEIELRKRLEELKQKEIASVELKYAQDSVKVAKEIELLKAQNAAAGSVKDIALRKTAVEKQAELDILEINQSKDSEELKAEKIKAVRLKLAKDLRDIDNEDKKRELDSAKLVNEQRIADEKYAAETILASNQSTFSEKQAAQDKIRSLSYQSLDVEKADLQRQLDEKIITQEDYERRMFEIKENYRQLDLKNAQEKAEVEKQLLQAVFNAGIELAKMAFDYRKEQLAREMEDVENNYTTDAEEAKKNANKKLITEQALAQKKLEIKRKQAQIEKQEAMFNIAISTATAILNAMNTKPFLPMGIAMAILAGTMGAIQLAMVAGKPLPAYAKGRRGGRGEFALVGEKGPETMWVPDGASIIPAHRKLNPATFREFGVPLPYVDSKEINDFKVFNEGIDYDKLGKAVGKYIPVPTRQSSVTVNVDKDGVTVQDGNSSTTFLNKKYTGNWN